MRKLLPCGFTLACLVAITAVAFAAPPPKSGTPPTFGGNAVFCNGPYALCITAYCPTPNGPPQKGQYINCECEIVNGWSMGPDTCSDRATKLVSTYSNLYNPGHKTVSCTSDSTLWAWCYGATCKPDPKNPKKKAICSCPVEQKPAVILAPEDHCNTAACDKVWSAATPHESTFANKYFFKVGTEKGYNPNPPAQACPATASN